MNTFLDPSIITTVMPILTALIILAIVLTLILVIGKNKQIQNLSITQNAFEKLVGELKADNEIMKKELSAIKVTLNSIHKMIEDVQ